MINGKSSFCLIIFFLMCTGMNSMAQTATQESKIVVDTLFNREIRLALPDGYKRQDFFMTREDLLTIVTGTVL